MLGTYKKHFAGSVRYGQRQGERTKAYIRDHVELPGDFHEKAKEKISAQMAKPVKEELRGR
jgi:hypothetical protein